MGAKAGYLPFPKGFETTLLHHGQEATQWSSKSIVPPIITSTIFQVDNPEKPEKYVYSRMQNPTRYVLERVLAAINKGEIGFCFSSGVSALTSMLGLLNHGDHILACEEMDGEHFNIFSCVAENFGIKTTFIDFTDTQCICSALQDNTKLLYTENPTNPTMKITDICAVSEIAKQKNILFAVDNTFLTPFLQRPLDLGADLVYQSMTKYMNGHSDTLLGSICMKDQRLQKEMTLAQTILGLTPSPFDCYQVLRGMRTLTLRMQDHLEKSITVAEFLENHDAVEKVIHLGLPSHPQHCLFKQQACGPSGVFSFYLKGGSNESQKFINNLNFFTLSDVGGGIESTVCIPSLTSHKSLTTERKARLCITDNLVKISVGLENVCDLICDLDSALGSLKDTKSPPC